MYLHMSALNRILERLDNTSADELKELSALASYFREQFQQHGEVNTTFGLLVEKLRAMPTHREGLLKQVQHLINDYSFFSLFTQYSHLDQSGFIGGVWMRLKHKILPQLPPPSDIRNLMREVFRADSDVRWLQQLPLNALTQLFGEELEALNTKPLERELQLAIQALGTKIGAFGLDHRIRSLFLRLELDTRPFANLQTALSGELTPEKISRAQTTLDAIRANITSLRLRKGDIGTTLKLTYESKKTLEKLAILKDLLALRATWGDQDQWLRVIANSWRSENSRMKLFPFINGHLDLVALEIVEHNAKSGEKYIADDKSEYYGMFRASMLGGLMIGFFAAGKILLYDLKLAELPEALLFSVNYAACFVLVKLMGGIIATKQPAMTASTIIKAVDKNNDLQICGLADIVNLIKRASRSQFISFAGNLAVAFPLAMLISWLVGQITGTPFIDLEKGEKLLKDIWPVAGGALGYAAIAGVFLALSGLISGYFDNKVIASNLETRLVRQPLLKRLLPLNFRQRAAAYLCHYLGALSGNISLGFFLGMAGYLGYLTGLPIDIRHIAFSSANFGFALQTIPVDAVTILLGALSILLIGAVNFAVSFGITLYLTLKSRSISFSETFRLLGRLGKALVLRPWEFVFTARAEKAVREPA